MEEIFYNLVNRAIKSSINDGEVFDKFIYEIINYHDKPAHTISELNHKTRHNKFKGPLFEYFCKKYFQTIQKIENVWLLKECPENILNELNLKRRDYGIDMIIENDGKFSSVQCKFKSPKKLRKDLEMKFHYQNVTWKDLSTFYSLCQRTGPKEEWDRLIVFTNSKYVNRKGKKNKKDYSICYNTLNRLTINDFRKLINEDKIIEENRIVTSNNIESGNISRITLNNDNIIKKRLEFYEKFTK